MIPNVIQLIYSESPNTDVVQYELHLYGDLNKQHSVKFTKILIMIK